MSDDEAGEHYLRLSEGDVTRARADPAIAAFYAELTAKHPEIDDRPEDELDDCPWSGEFDRSDGHIIVNCVWSQAEEMHREIVALATKHGLACFDPQAERVTYPGSSPHVERKPWWKMW